ncbi:hypothetical protein [Novosphingobium rosa]|uniref:hypothetical protein n=1 Tax=Novosphingobium rosa TaxID=76978 RepID=UPI00082996CD|nr:hypothetical protein [Novosphingobium rosa]
MDELDLSGVDAMRRPEVRRRVGVVRDYLNIVAPTEMDLRRHADLLGLSINQFKALVRAWRVHQSPAKMAGSGAHRGSPRRANRISVPKAAKEAAARVIDEMGPDAPFVRINEAVVSHCKELGAAPPSRSTLWNMVMVSRKQPHGGEEGLVVGSCAVRLPMRQDGAIVMPMLGLAVRADDGAIVAASLGPADWHGFTAGISGSGLAVRVDAALIGTDPIDGVTPIPSTAARSALSRILGRGIDDVRLVYLTGKAIAPERLLKTRQDSPLTLADVREVVAGAIARHNQSRGAPAAIWIDAPSRS